jgi:hypothetical protein
VDRTFYFEKVSNDGAGWSGSYVVRFAEEAEQGSRTGSLAELPYRIRDRILCGAAFRLRLVLEPRQQTRSWTCHRAS